MLEFITPATYPPPPFYLDRWLVRTFMEAILGAMKFPLALRYSWIISQYSVLLIDMILGGLLGLLFTGRYYTSNWIILIRHPCGFVAARIDRLWLRGWTTIDVVRIPFPVIFNLHSGQKITPFFVEYGTMVLVLILQFILHGCRASILSGKANYIFIEFFVADVTIFLIVLPALLWKWR